MRYDFSFIIDIRWVIDELLKDGIIDQKNYHLINIAKKNSKSHPLVIVAKFSLKSCIDHRQLTMEYLNQWLANKAGLSYVKIDPLKVQVAKITKIMSFEYAKNQHILPVEVSDDTVTIGTDQPFFTDWHESVQKIIAPKQFKSVYLSPEQILRYRTEFYQVTHAIDGANSLHAPNPVLGNVEALLQLGDVKSADANDQHIVKVVDWLLQYAFDQLASDIHLEPRRDTAKVRFRIDGVLHTVYQMPAPIMTAVVARLKILARLNIAEKRKPQDGRLKTRTPKGQETELRLSTLPTAFGEKLVMRIFDPEVLVRSFDKLGLSGSRLKLWNALTSHPNGIILVTGPTGSGKTTTLYSTLKKLATEDVNVCTIEDPIEMIEESFNQMQVNASIELSFADGIRALMRQDPDIIMIGEIRDQQTASMAVQASLTGHLVLSTLHTNDAPSALTRLHDLDVPPFMTSATVLGIVAQRLVRTLCPHCKSIKNTDDDIIFKKQWQELIQPWQVVAPKKIYHAVGCDACRGTGYKGRVGLYEIMVMDNVLKKCIADNEKLDVLKQTAYKQGLMPLRIEGAKRIIEGVTTMDEILRVVPLN